MAVKVQYPGVATAASADLRVCSLLASAYAAVGGEHVTAFRNILRDLSARIRKEVDYRQEVLNSTQLADKLANTSGVSVPRPVDALTSRRLFVMEWIDGARISDSQALQRQGLDLRAVGARFLSAFADMLYVHGFLHGDLHPGNILVRGNRDNFDIVLLDHGYYVSLPDALRQQYCKLWCAFVLHDVEAAERVACEIAGPQGRDIVPAVLRTGAMQRAIGRKPAGHAAQQQGSLAQALGGLASLSAVSHFPREVVEILRLSQSARDIGAHLGCLPADRLAINAKHALAGLSIQPQGNAAVCSPEEMHHTRLHVSLTELLLLGNQQQEHRIRRLCLT